MVYFIQYALIILSIVWFAISFCFMFYSID